MIGRVPPPLARACLSLAFVLVIGVVWNGDGAFFTGQFHTALLGSTSVAITGLLAIGMTFVILTAGIDLSVGSVLAASGVAFAALTVSADWSPLLAIGVAMTLGASLGAANGAMVAKLRFQPFIATLLMMVGARGLARWLPSLTGVPAGAKIAPSGEVPAFFLWLSGDLIAGVPVVGALFVALAALAGFVLHRTTLGRWVFAIGGNETAARLAGIPVARVKLATYALCGACAALAGVCQAAQDRLGNPAAGAMYELNAIAAVVIGGTSLGGGRGGILLTVIGTLTIGYVGKTLSVNSVPDHWQLMIQALIIFTAVLLQERR